MNENERTLIEGALKSASTVLCMGLKSTDEQVYKLLSASPGGCARLDLRGGAVDLAALRADLAARLVKHPTLLVLIDDKPSEAVRTVLDELKAGALRTGADQPEKVAAGVRVVALAAAGSDVAGLMALQIRGMAIMEKQRVAVEHAEAEARAAQVRAEDSSRRAGLA